MQHCTTCGLHPGRKAAGALTAGKYVTSSHAPILSVAKSGIVPLLIAKLAMLASLPWSDCDGADVGNRSGLVSAVWRGGVLSL